MPQIEENPFLPLTAFTPTGLRITRKAEMEKNLGDDYWAKQMGNAGLDIRNELMEQGIAMSPEDRKALGVQRVMEESQKRQSEAIKTGADPLDAQEMAVMDAMGSFMNLGDFESAQALAPQLAKLREYRGELAKLKSETGENEAQISKANVEAEIKKLEFELKKELNPWRIKEIQARIAKLNRVKEGKESVLDKLGIIDPKDLGISNKAHDENRIAIGSAFNMFDAMERLSQFYDSPETARAASTPGQALNVAGQYLSGIQQAIRGSGGGAPSTYMEDTTREGDKVGDIVRKARPEMAKKAQSLGISVSVYESLVVDAAYAIARSQEPGGRLSNNDFAVAMQQLGAVQDPASAKAVFASLAERTYNGVQNRMRGYTPEVIQAAYGPQMANLEARYGQFVEKRGLGPVPAAASVEQYGTPRRKTLRGKTYEEIRGQPGKWREVTK